MPVDQPRPLGLTAELTYRCPLRCPYCSNPTRYPDGDELSAADWSRVFRQAGELGVAHALLTGGEPLLRTDLAELIDAARWAGLYTNLITSGLGLTRERAEELKAAGLDSVQLSLQSDEAELADNIAGVTAHEKKLAVARLVREMEWPLTINVVLHRANIDRLPQIFTLANALDAMRLELASAQFYGWGFQNRRVLMPTREQTERADAVVAATPRKPEMQIVYVAQDYYSGRPKPCMSGWGQRYIVVNPVGEAMPCSAAGVIEGLKFDNVRNRDLKWIWDDSAAFNRFRGEAWMEQPCASCDRRHIDFGGCRCQAALLTGSATRTDPACALAPQRSVIASATGDLISLGHGFTRNHYRRNP